MSRSSERAHLTDPVRLMLVENDVDDIHATITVIKTELEKTNDKIGRSNTLLTSILVALLTIMGGGIFALLAVR